jgi:hypothetical protein
MRFGMIGNLGKEDFDRQQESKNKLPLFKKSKIVASFEPIYLEP